MKWKERMIRVQAKREIKKLYKKHSKELTEIKGRIADYIEKVKEEQQMHAVIIAFKGNHIEKFRIGKELGEWKLEAEGEAKFLGEKRYYIKDQARCSGLMKREISKEIIEREENVQTKRMIGLLTGITKGRMEEVGTFEDYVQEMKPHNKLMLITPETIDEVKEYAI